MIQQRWDTHIKDRSHCIGCIFHRTIELHDKRNCIDHVLYFFRVGEVYVVYLHLHQNKAGENRIYEYH